tara:strand:- start:788 stop:1012 length:225 start_codon:yes stop_codon:yes gene_type:complete
MIVDKPKQNGIVIDLTGPQGNAFFLIGTAKNLGKQVGMSPKNIDKMVERMTSGDYEHLLSEFEFEFGSVVTLYR